MTICDSWPYSHRHLVMVMIYMMISLEKQSGLAITLDSENLTLNFSDDVAVGRVSHRTFEEMRKFIREPGAKPSYDPIYTVWRQVSKKIDPEAIEKAGLRYDLTLIPTGKFISDSHAEFFRTAGHYHKTELPEVYEVLHGRAYLIIQRPSRSDFSRIEEIYAIEAGVGEKIVIPPGFGHISVNPYEQPLLLANLISQTVEYDYQPFSERRGAGYWVMEGPTAETIEFEPNNNYASVPELKKLRPKEVPELGLLRSKPAYTLTDGIEKLHFLNAPEEFQNILTIDYCYQVIV